MFDAYIGTTSGIHRLRDGRLEALGLEDEKVSAVYVDETLVLAGTYGNGLYRSTDGGERWERVEEGLTAAAFRWLGVEPGDANSLLAGTEPARIFRSRDRGETWEEFETIAGLPDADRWFLPYSPRAGAVRNIYAPPGRPDHLLASLEVGGLLRSEDGGGTWVCEPVIADEDIHHVTGHPDDDDLLYVSLGTASLTRREQRDPSVKLGGIARSTDGGGTWEKLETDYTRATIVPPSNPELILAGPAPQVGRNGRIVVSVDGGDSWEPAGAGIDIPMHDMVELFTAAPDGSVWAICSQGRLLRADPSNPTWRSALPPNTQLEVKSIAYSVESS